jgi:hypothetical protein
MEQPSNSNNTMRRAAPGQDVASGAPGRGGMDCNRERVLVAIADQGEERKMLWFNALGKRVH